ncbi:hypothetical protein ACOCJ4_11175 [Knoellia sp. CPCC 206435]|uniref:hypothetical protein n=1 Tax=Knoellia terrae TaxID=3404797 RepID=UPI003B439E16
MEPMPPLQGAVRPTTVEVETPPRHPRLAALGDLALGIVFVAFITGRLHDEGFSWFLVVLLIVASAGLAAKIATHSRLLWNRRAEGQGVAEPS